MFGCRQRGAAAVEAQNVFYHLTYEGAVDIEAIADPVMKAAAVEQIRSFGQTPGQVACECCEPFSAFNLPLFDSSSARVDVDF